jgi:hypothetical protein
VSAVILSLLFFASGIWKLTDLDATAERMVQSLIPVALSVPAAITVAIAETFTGVLLLIPRFRRWGSWITDPPYAVALDRGKAVARFNSGQLEAGIYYETLKRLGHLN